MTKEEFREFQSLWCLIYGWCPTREEIKWDDQQIKDWVSRQK